MELKEVFMHRLVVLFFLLWFCCEVTAQEVSITRSSDIIVLRGESFYLHTVLPGQTLYSICKAYGVDVEEMKVLNHKKDNNLSLYEVLKVPYKNREVMEDGKFYYHKVVKGETLYSIARDFGIRPKNLLKYNENYTDKMPLSVGAVVKLPLNGIDRAVLKQKSEEQAGKMETVSPVVKDEQKGTVVATEQQEESPVVSTGKEKHEKMRDVKAAEPSQNGHQPKEMPAYISEVVLPSHPFVKIALLLPFSAKEYAHYDTVSNRRMEIPARSEQFVAFYEGILLAADSLKSKGYKIDLRVFDTERNVEKTIGIADKMNELQPDLIIGPVYGSIYKAMADHLEKKDIPMVYPLSSRSESFGEYPNFIQVNASMDVLSAKMASWLKKQRANANIINIDLKETGDQADVLEKKLFMERIKQIDGVQFFHWNAAETPLHELRTILLPDRENIIILPTSKEAEVSKILPILSALADHYRMTVVGFPEWQTFTSVDHETYYKLNTKIFTYSYVDVSSDAARVLAQKYRKYFYAEPGNLVFKAFDMGVYFMELAAKYRDRTLEAIEYSGRNGDFSSFHFEKMKHGLGKENEGFLIVNFGSDYQLKIEVL
ncbi:MAG: LysM peptidoglycan-binding domain-containing protein [Odoribacter sp.]